MTTLACSSGGFDVANSSGPIQSDAAPTPETTSAPAEDTAPSGHDAGSEAAPDTAPAIDTAPTPDTAPGVDAADACTQNGATACDDYVTASCQRLLDCCIAWDGTCDPRCVSTDGDTCTLDNCRALTVKMGVDCASTRFTSVTVCDDVTQKCVDDLPLVACSDLLGGTAHPPATCNTFLAQFP
jgi:hypothetical protein